MKEAFNELFETQKKNREQCPWAKIQNIEGYSLYLKDELEELLTAIKNKDWNNVKEETGDMFLILVFLSVMAEEKGLFTLKEVIQTTTEKIKLRKPWVFSDMKGIDNPEKASQMWKEIKEKLK